MDEKENVVNINGEQVKTEEIKATDFVEPQGKVRKVIKWALNALAIAGSFAIGLIVGHHTGKDDGNESNNPAENESTESNG
jgi:hypothetical protein